jgi:hypothetical protein
MEKESANRNLINNFTFNQKENLPDSANANIHAAMSNTFVCITALLSILFHG